MDCHCYLSQGEWLIALLHRANVREGTEVCTESDDLEPLTLCNTCGRLNGGRIPPCACQDAT